MCFRGWYAFCTWRICTSAAGWAVSLEQEQRYALEQILFMAKEQADAVLIAGDLYDKSQPSGAAVDMVSWFLTELSRLSKPVFVISGNHDSPQQVAYCAGLLSGAQVHVAGAFEGHVPCRADR